MLRRLRIVLAIFAFAALVVFAFGGVLTRATLAAIVDTVTGMRVAFDDVKVGMHEATFTKLALDNAAGEPVLRADRATLGYRLRDAVFGGDHRYGLLSVEIDRPVVSLIRHADGTFNIGSTGSSGTASAGGGPGTPLRFSAIVRDASIALADPNRQIALSRELSLSKIAVAATVDTAGHSAYRVSGDVEGFSDQAFTLAGRIDASGYALHRLRATTIAIAPLVDYAINSRSARVDRGVAHDVDVRAYAFGDPTHGLGPYHLLGGARLENGELRIPGLIVPASEMNGRIDVVDDGIATRNMTARLGHVAVRVAGGLYHWAAPAFRLGVVADTRLASLRELFAFSQRLPIGGAAHVETLLESSVGSPLVATAIVAPHATYASFPFRGLTGRAIYDANALDLVGVGARYGALGVGIEGAIALGNVARTQLVVDAHGSADGVPYAAQLAPGADLNAVALVAGSGLKMDARGVANGTSRETSLAGIFHVDPEGDGAFGPIAIRAADGADAVGAFYLHRRANESGFWADAHALPFARVLGDPHLPGLAIAPPVFGGRLDGAIAGVGPPSNFRIAGAAHASAFEVAGVRIDDVRTQLAGTFASVRLGAVVARGPWGSFRGSGGYVGATKRANPLAQTLALTGAYTGTFARLRTFTGNVAARGDLAGSVALLLSPQRTIVQTIDARSSNGSIAGVPVDRISGTIAVANKRVRVYAATATVARGPFAAAGFVDAARGVGVSVADVDATQLHRLVPLGIGRIAAIGRLTSQGTVTRYDGGLSVGEATFDRLPLGGNGDIALAGTHLGIRRTDAVLGPALGSLSGSLDRLGTKEPRYDLGVRVTALRIAPLANAIVPERHDIAGTLVGDVVVRGTPATLGVDGKLGVPEGTVNGLAFDRLSLAVAIDPGALEVRGGQVTVGTTNVRFGARFAGNDASTHVIAHAANLADFNDYFDAGDTLGGTGSVDVRFRKHGAAVRTRAALAIDALRYRRFDLGDASAHWTSSGRDVTGAIAFGGASGRLETAGTLTLATRSPLDKLLERSRFDGAAKLRGLDLGVWLPALGYQVPVGGRIDADASIAGALRNPDVKTTLSLSNGTVGKFPVDRLVIAATSTLRRTTVTHAELDLPSVAVTGSGSFGLGERDPIAFSVHGKSADIGPIAARLGERLPVEGALEADVKIDGTRAKPRVAGGFDLEKATLHGVAIPQALGEVTVSGRDIVLSDAQVGFAKGTLYLAGSVPLEVAPFGFGPAASPITLDFNAKAIDLADFAPLLPDGSLLKGALDGHVAVGGTAGNPRLDGSVGVASGEFRAPFETTPLTGVVAKLSFAGSAATLEGLHADAGGGTLDASGGIQFPNLVRPGIDAAYHVDASAKKFALDVPAFVDGTIDGTLAIRHQPQQRPQLSATLALDDATIPFSALLVADTGTNSGFDASAVTAPAIVLAPVLSAPDVGLALDLTADRNVRVRSANVDIGAHGTLHITGSRSDPQLDGVFTSTGGTLSYFNTVFRLLDGTVTFQPDLGVIPNLDAHAITHVLNPDPNTVRNVTGSADVTLDVHGPVTGLTIGLSSDPNYDRQQILGLLLSAPALGATNLFGDNRGQATLYGTNTPAQPTTITGQRTTTGDFNIAQEAFSIANAQFTRTLLAPIETNIADALQLTNINVNVDYTGNVGLTARKILGKKVNAIYGTSFGYPYRQTFGFEIKPSNSTAAQVTVFQTLGAYGVDSLTPTTYLNTVNSKISNAQPSQGTAGFSISLQHLFR